ncbi:MAG: methyltransferase domain-containing protein [Saprospiraceae bacterium]|nr:methyltransferase domain-containing protein [Saprospiraceae bacterium]
MKRFMVFIFLAWGFFSCDNRQTENTVSAENEHVKPGHQHDHNHANREMNSRPFESLVANFESAERDEWQQPDKVMAYLGDLQGKRVMDIGSGSGYFSFRMHQAGAKVICADVDQRFLDYIAQKRDSLGVPEADIETRKIPYDSSTLGEGEVDMVIIVDTYHHIENRIAYFEEVRKGIKSGGNLVVIDFFKRELPVGPSVDHKISKEEVMEELQQAGYTSLALDTTLLPYQFLIRAGF